MIPSILKAWRLHKGWFCDLDSAENSPSLVRRLWLHGSSWKTKDHSLARCRELLPQCMGLIEFEIGWLNWSKLPMELGALPVLESVVSLNSTIEEFPYFLRDCPRLKRLAIRGGDVHQVNDSILEFQALRDLDLAGNPLTKIPHNLKRRLGLTRLELHDTPISMGALGLNWSRLDYPGVFQKPGEH